MAPARWRQHGWNQGSEEQGGPLNRPYPPSSPPMGVCTSLTRPGAGPGKLGAKGLSRGDRMHQLHPSLPGPAPGRVPSVLGGGGGEGCQGSWRSLLRPGNVCADDFERSVILLRITDGRSPRADGGPNPPPPQ